VRSRHDLSDEQIVGLVGRIGIGHRRGPHVGSFAPEGSPVRVM
jgi:hypothetical protein